ncbi:HD domain-containing protein, partial [Candidatus Omnitrophota bacterium]
QTRKGGGITSFVVHPISVALLLARYTQDENTLISAILHDALEDTSYSPKEIKREFGSRVLTIVRDVSDKLPNDPWAKRKEAYIRRLRKISKEACLIACADKIHNLQALINGYKKSGDAIWSYFNAPKEEKIAFYEAVYREARKRFKHPIIRELGNNLREAKKCLSLV